MLFVSWSCSESIDTDLGRTKPEHLISRHKMINILKEIHLAESVVSSSGLTYTKSLARFKRYKLFIFKKYDIDSASFSTNFNYYMGHQKDSEHIYKALEDTFLIRKHHKNFN